MNRHFRTAAAVCLVATATLSVLWTVLVPEFHSDGGAQLDAFVEAGTSASVSALMFVLSQLPFAVGMVGVAVWLHPVSPRLATAGGVLATLGAFGHSVIGGTTLMQLLMAGRPEHREAYATLLEDSMDAPLMLPFFVFGLGGTVLGVLLLAVAHFRAHTEPRWVGPALWAFLLLEFVGSNLSSWSAYLGGVCYLVALVTLARSMRSGAPGAQTRPRTPAPVASQT